MDYTYWSALCRENKRPKADEETFFVEAQGPFRLSFIVRGAAADVNAARAAVEAVFAAHQGNAKQKVQWLFQLFGEIYISKYANNISEDNIMLVALSLGALDIEFGVGDVARILTKPEKLEETAAILEMEDMEALSCQLCYQPKDLFEICDDGAVQEVVALMNDLMALEVVMDISANFLLNDLCCKRMGFDV